MTPNNLKVTLQVVTKNKNSVRFESADKAAPPISTLYVLNGAVNAGPVTLEMARFKDTRNTLVFHIKDVNPYLSSLYIQKRVWDGKETPSKVNVTLTATEAQVDVEVTW